MLKEMPIIKRKKSKRKRERESNISLKRRLIGASACARDREKRGDGRFSSGRRASSIIPGIRVHGTRNANMMMKGMHEGGHGESKGRVHTSCTITPLSSLLAWDSPLYSRGGNFTRRRFRFTESEGGGRKKNTRERYKRDWVADNEGDRG